MLKWLARRGSATAHLAASFSEWHTHRPAGHCPRHVSHQGLASLPEHVPNLQTLILIASPCCLVAEHDLKCLQILTALRQLDLLIASNGTWQHDTLEWLQHLQRLEALDIDVRGMGQRPLLLPPSFGTLTRLTYVALRRGPSKDDPRYNTTNIAESVSKLTCLEILNFANVIDQFPTALAGPTKLQTVRLEGTDPEDWPSLSNYFNCEPNEKDDIGALVLPTPNWLSTCQALAALPYLATVSFDDVDLADIRQDQWAFSNHLTSLSLVGCHLESLPAALVSLTSLQYLVLAYNPLDILPAGPYLANLTELNLCDTLVHELPKALCKASSLCKVWVPSSGLDTYGDTLKAILPPECELEGDGAELDELAEY